MEAPKTRLSETYLEIAMRFPCRPYLSDLLPLLSTVHKKKTIRTGHNNNKLRYVCDVALSRIRGTMANVARCRRSGRSGGKTTTWGRLRDGAATPTRRRITSPPGPITRTSYLVNDGRRGAGRGGERDRAGSCPAAAGTHRPHFLVIRLLCS